MVSQSRLWGLLPDEDWCERHGCLWLVAGRGRRLPLDYGGLADTSA